jgi:long-subunit fatty acid transport protein
MHLQRYPGLYKTDKWAAFAAFTIPAGGGKVEYNQGDATTFALASQIIAGSGSFFSAIDSQKLEADSFYYGHTLGAAYEFNDMIKDDVGLFTQGEKLRRDLPGLLGLGVGYTITPNVRVEASYTYYLEKSATWDDRASTTRDESKGGNSYNLAVALTYIFSPKLKGSVGYMPTNTGISPDKCCQRLQNSMHRLFVAGYRVRLFLT